MSRRVSIDPAGGKSLADQLFELGVEFPCGGGGGCGLCRVKVISGQVPVTAAMRAVLTNQELATGWRLACEASATESVEIEVAQWTPRILTDEAVLDVEPRPGLGLAVDVGTTTVVAQLVDLTTGEILGVEAELNTQARYGTDLMSRVETAMREPGLLTELIRGQIATMAAKLTGGRWVEEVLLCGNTVMHHLYAGLDVTPLAAVPFRTPHPQAAVLDAAQSGIRAGWAEFLPVIGGFAGSDLLCGIIATGLADSPVPAAIMDLGTNGEVAVARDGKMKCASTAAGPAFEAGGIRRGMRAGDGAIEHARVHDGVIECHVLGGDGARGICGSGLVDVVAAALDLGLIRSNGRLANGSEIPLRDGVSLYQSDVRQLQLAKGAAAAALALLGGVGAQLHLAGAFGNYLREASARRIGLLPATSAVTPAGNTALRGVRHLLLQHGRRNELLHSVLSRTTHVELAADASFQDAFADHMALAPVSD
ncbi:MAG TPA: ASKHA domain-containing protein [Bryobacteraceae bacterium]|nr:ASKHA domain-containing protein [Bryobacteraceae bacterium]